MEIPALSVVAVGLLVSAQTAYAGPILGTKSASSGVVPVSPNSATSLSALIAIGPLAVFPPCFVIGACPKIALFEGIDSSAAGTSYTVADFTGVVSKLTNGSLDYISAGVVPGPSYGTSSGGSVGFPETEFGTSPDFAGQTIGSVVLRIDGVTTQPTNFRIDYTLTVFGATTVPEPSSWLLLAGSLAVMIRRQGSNL